MSDQRPATATITDSGYYHVVVEHPVAATLTQPRQNDSVFNRGHCLTTGRGPLTWSCGDAMYFLETPGFTTLDRDRSMTLVYTSNTAAPAPIIAANVTMPAAPTFDHMYAVLSVDGTVRTHATYGAWTGSTKQIALSWDALSAATGAHPYTLTVYTVSGSDSTASTAASGLTTVVNRSASPYGNGWAWLGVERLVLSQPVGTSDNDILWVDGDGSSRLYHPDGSNKWLSAMDDGQDSIAYASSQYTLTTRHGVQVIFDNTGRHTQTKNRAGQITTFAWADSVSLDSVLLPPSGSGKAFKVQYTSGRMSGVVVGGRNIIDTVDVSGGPPELTRWVWPDGTSMRFGYESHHKLTYSVYSDADYVWLHYDTLGLVHISDVYYNRPANSTTNYTAITLFTPWQEFGHADTTLSYQTAADTAGAYTSIKGPPIDTVTGNGPTTTFGIDRWGAPVYERDPYGTVMRYLRNDAHAPGLVSEIDFPNSRKAFMQYDSMGRGNITRLADSTWGSEAFPKQVTTWAYADPNDYDSPSAVTAPDSTTTHYTYNTLGLTATETDPRSHTTAYAYNTSGSLVGQLTSVTEESVPTWIDSLHTDRDTNLVTALSYDAWGNTVGVTDPAGGTTRFGRDGAGRITSTVNALGLAVHRLYDAMDRDTTLIRFHGDSGASSTCHTSEFTCDTTLIAASLNPVGGDTEVTRMAYTLGRLTEVDDPRGVRQRYDYDQRGLVIRSYDQKDAFDQFTYDDAGNLIQELTRNRDTLAFTYDSLNREVSWTMPSKSTTLFAEVYTAPGDTVTSRYDNMGNLIYHANRLGDITRTYFANGMLRTEAHHAGTGSGGHLVADSVRMAYDPFGRVDSLLWVGDTVRYGYLGSGDLGHVYTDWRNGATTRHDSVALVWDAMGRRQQVRYPFFSMAATSHYDALGTLRMMLVQNSAATSPNRFQDSLVQDQVDVLGRVLHQHMFCRGFSGSEPGDPCGDWLPTEQTTRYNRVGQMVVQATSNAALQTTTDTFAYDLSGDRVMQHHRALVPELIGLEYPIHRTRVYARYDTLPTTGDVGIVKYTYDSLGNRRIDAVPIPGDTAAIGIYQYDAAGRLAGLADANASYPQYPRRLPSACSYDPDGRAVTLCSLESNAEFSLLGDDVVHDPNGNWFYVHAPGIDEAVLAIRRSTADTSELARLDIVSDGMGQVLALGDSAGGLNSSYAYAVPGSDGGPWGSGIMTRRQTFDPRRWAAAVHGDTISSFRTRQYDPATGSWMQEDHAGLAGGVNLYEYNGNDPNSFSDPFGLQACKDSQGNAVDCPEPPGGPKVALPPGPNGEKNSWRVPDQNNQGGDRTKWTPKYKVRTPGGEGGQPDASWDKQRGHWDVNSGQGGKSRKFLPDGTEVDHDNRPVSGHGVSKPMFGISPAVGAAAAGAGAAGILLRILSGAESFVPIIL